MLYVEMNSDIRDYEPKVLAMFTRRQLLCLCLALIYGVPLALLVPLGLGLKIAVAAVFMTPTILCGYVKAFGMPLEKFVINCVIPVILKPQKKIYMTDDNVFGINEDMTGKKKVKRSKNIKGYR